MLQIIVPSETVTEYAYRRIFRSDHECHGFHCDEQGNPIFKGPADKKLFDKCVEKQHFKDCGRVRREYTRVTPAIGRCECGCKLRLEKIWGQDAIPCRCGRSYTVDGKEKENKERSAS